MEGRVSVIIPVFNGADYLAEAIQSALNQTRPIHEIVVVDDGSTDDSGSLALSFGDPIRCVTQSNQGTAAARNHGVRVSNGNLIAFLDQDDNWQPEKTELQMGLLAEEKDIAAVFGLVRQFVSPDLADDVAARFAVPGQPQEGYNPSAMMVRRDAFLDIGFFDERWAHSEWIEWLLRLNESGIRTRMLQEVVAGRRIHAGNKGVVNRSGRGEYLRALKESLDRRRGSS